MIGNRIGGMGPDSEDDGKQQEDWDLLESVLGFLGSLF